MNISKFFLFVFLFGCCNIYSSSFANKLISDTCEYKSQFEQCKSEINKRNIEDFVCISGNDYKVMGQIALDVEFKKIDKKAENYISELEKNKSLYFGKSAQKSLVEGVDELETKFSLYGEDSFGKEYYALCGTGIVSKVVDCFGSVPNVDVTDFFKTETCKLLAITKLQVYKSVAQDVLKLNKLQVAKDEKKLNTQERRTKYDTLLEIIMVNAGYMERIWKKWPSKTKNPHKG